MAEDKSSKLLALAGRLHRESVLLGSMEPKDRIVDTIDDLEVIADHLKTFGARIVLTMGTFDLFHIGHARYIKKARENGDFLILGVDDDKKAQGRKGENRPAVPYVERSELLGYLRYVDLVAKKSYDHEKWQMIKVVRPHVLIAVRGTYTDEELEKLAFYCDEVKVLDRQAETSTSAKIRRMVLDGADRFATLLAENLPEFVKSVYHKMKAEES